MINFEWNIQEVLAEPIQTVLRRHGVSGAYEQLKALTRGKEQLSKTTLNATIDNLPLPEKVKKELKSLTPAKYTGYASDLVKDNL